VNRQGAGPGPGPQRPPSQGQGARPEKQSIASWGPLVGGSLLGSHLRFRVVFGLSVRLGGATPLGARLEAHSPANTPVGVPAKSPREGRLAGRAATVGGVVGAATARSLVSPDSPALLPLAFFLVSSETRHNTVEHFLQTFSHFQKGSTA